MGSFPRPKRAFRCWAPEHEEEQFGQDVEERDADDAAALYHERFCDGGDHVSHLLVNVRDPEAPGAVLEFESEASYNVSYSAFPKRIPKPEGAKNADAR